ncbi:MAG: hypothetical protein ACPGVU_20045, partial [Limisphaerales bacterium]
MNAKAVTAFLVLAGLFGGYKLGQKSAAVPAPVVESTPSEPNPTPAIARTRTERAAPEPVVTSDEANLDLVVRRVHAALTTSSSTQRMANVADAVRNVRPHQVAELMERLRSRVNGSYGYMISYALLPMWAETDPAAALAYAQRITASQSYAIGSVVRGWARMDLNAALAYVQQMPGGSNCKVAAAAILPAIAEQDPAQAIAFIREEGLTSSSTRGPLPTVLTSLSLADPNAAAQEIMKLPAGSQRDNAFRSLAREWAQKDPQAALAFVQTLPRNNSRRYAMTAVLGEMAARDPNTAVQVASGLTGSTRTEAFSAIASSWAKTDLNGALSWAENLQNGADRERAMRNVASLWAAQDPQSAAYADGLPAGKQRNDLITAVASAWSRNDAANSLVWLENQPPSAAKNSAVSRAVNYLADQDPVSAAKWINIIPTESSRNGLYDDIA